MKRDEEDVKKLICCFSSQLMINPFNTNKESLFNFATGVVLAEEVADALLASRSKGQEQMKTFVKKWIQTNEVSYWDAIPQTQHQDLQFDDKEGESQDWRREEHHRSCR